MCFKPVFWHMFVQYLQTNVCLETSKEVYITYTGDMTGKLKALLYKHWKKWFVRGFLSVYKSPCKWKYKCIN